MNRDRILQIIKETESPLKRHLLMVALISRILEERGKEAPIVIGGCALSYYSREVYFTADIDLAYADCEALDILLKEMGFRKEGRYWISDELEMALEVPTSSLVGENAPVEIVEFDEGLTCKILGIEDLIIDRLNACKHWKSQIDCEMVELLIRRYKNELEWDYLEKRGSLPENNTFHELRELRKRIENEDKK